MTIPAAAAAAYRAAAQATAQTPTTSITPANLPGGNFPIFFRAIRSPSQHPPGRNSRHPAGAGQGQHRDVVQSVNAAELLDTVLRCATSRGCLPVHHEHAI